MYLRTIINILLGLWSNRDMNYPFSMSTRIPRIRKKSQRNIPKKIKILQ